MGLLAAGVRLLSAYVGAARAVLGQLRVDAKTNEHKAALRLLGVLPLAGKVVTGDAVFTHRDVAAAIRQAGADYVLVVKDNQPELKAPIEQALHGGQDFSPHQRRRKAEAEEEARSTDKGHGRREYRRLCGTTLLRGYLDWPDAARVFEPERVRVPPGETEVEVVHGVTSLRRGRADAAALLGLVRGHWGIENGLHDVGDETLGRTAAGCAGGTGRGCWRRCARRRCTWWGR